MIDINNNALGAVGEHQTLSRLLLLGYQAAITNLSVKNDESADILCRDTKGKFVAIQDFLYQTIKVKAVNFCSVWK